MSQTIAGALVGGALGAYGKKPEIPAFVGVDPTKSQASAIAGNILNFDEASKLVSQTNTFNQNELDALMERALPGGSSVIKQNILEGLQGKLAPGTLANIRRAVAERGVAGGTGLSGFNIGEEALQIGRTTEDQITRSLSSAQQWLAQSVVPQMNIANMFFTPQQRLAHDTSERNSKFSHDLLQAQVDAAPDPNMVALAEGFDNFFKTWSSVGTGMIGGGGMGGGAPTGGGGAPPASTPPRTSGLGGGFGSFGGQQSNFGQNPNFAY